METTRATGREGVAAAFREARDERGLSRRELASLLGTSSREIEEIEADDNILFTRYSPAEIKLIAEALGVAPEWLLRCECAEPPLDGPGLVELLSAGARRDPAALERFEREVGWRVAPLLESPGRLLAEVTVEAMGGLAAAFGIDWRRVVAGL